MFKRKKKMPEYVNIFVRYFLLLSVGIPNLWLFYFIFTPLTVYAVYLLLDLFYNVLLMGNVIIVSNSFPIEIVDACVAGSAYYLLLIFNLAIPNIKLKKRITMLLFSFSSFFVINIIRITLTSFLLVSGTDWFDFAHKLFWYIGSIVFVVGIWFLSVKIFKIKEVPFYSDIKFFIKKIKRKS